MSLKRFLTYEETAEKFRDKTVAIVGSGPGCLRNEPGYIDGHDLVIRINSYKLRQPLGKRTDVFYSFFGNSVRKERHELREDGVKLCMCKCPNDKIFDSYWHNVHKKQEGVDFRYIYQKKRNWLFCDTYVPTKDRFMEYFHLLEDHIPTTGFACILDVLSFPVKKVYITGFDFFTSEIHNVDEKWFALNNDDPIKHVPHKELDWLRNNYKNYPVEFDTTLSRLIHVHV